MFRNVLTIILLTGGLVSCGGSSTEDQTTDQNEEALERTIDLEAPAAAPPQEAPTMNAILESGANFQTLATAIQAAGMEEVLNKRDITLLAPNNDAFMALGESKLATLLDPSKKEQLKKILQNHVVQGVFTTTELKNGQTLTTLGGTQLSVKVNDGQIMIGNASIVASNIASKNGVIQAIDGVL
ncbi:MAG: fasciclin domain-containing protein [Thermonemataceae bacterium]